MRREYIALFILGFLLVFSTFSIAQFPSSAPDVGSGAGGGPGTVTVAGGGNLNNNSIMTGGGSQISQTPCNDCTLDSNGNMILAGTQTVGNGSGNAGAEDFVAGTVVAVPANSFGWGVGPTMTTSQRLQSPNVAAAAHTVMIIGAPASNISTFAYKVLPDCQDSGGNHLNFTQSTDTFSCGTTGGGGGAYSVSQGKLANVTQNGSDVVLFTQASVPALAAGSCYAIEFSVLNNTVGAYATKLYVGGSAVVTLWTASSANNELDHMKFNYCNNAGVQNAQNYTISQGWYCTSSCNVASILNPYTFSAGIQTPTAVNWSMSQTIAIETNGASGTLTPEFFRIGQ